jgi:hypothetical protein
MRRAEDSRVAREDGEVEHHLSERALKTRGRP